MRADDKSSADQRFLQQRPTILTTADEAAVQRRFLIGMISSFHSARSARDAAGRALMHKQERAWSRHVDLRGYWYAGLSIEEAWPRLACFVAYMHATCSETDVDRMEVDAAVSRLKHYSAECERLESCLKLLPRGPEHIGPGPADGGVFTFS